MYHDEFARRPVDRTPKWDDFLPDLAMQVGGGLSLALAASLNRSASMALFTVGGQLPIIAWSLSMTVAQAVASLSGLASKVGSEPPSALPAPHMLANPRTMAAGRLRQRKAVASR